MLMAVCVLSLLCGGCITQARIDKKYASLESEWRAKNASPSTTPLPAEVGIQLKAEAKSQVEAEVKAERELAVDAAGKVATGDFVGGGMAIIGLVVALLGAKV